MSAHSSEPWRSNGHEIIADDVVIAECHMAVSGHRANSSADGVAANAARAVACVNALAGVDDPAALIAAVRAMCELDPYADSVKQIDKAMAKLIGAWGGLFKVKP